MGPGMILGGVKALSSIAGGIIGSGKRKREQRRAQAGYDKTLARLENMDTSNPYANQQNVYEDLTVNTQQADMLAQQQQQALGNTMQNLQGAAGGSGIAALAQSMANQQSQNLQAATASIGQQEAQNQRLMLGQEAQMQQNMAEGDMMSRQMEASKTTGMLNRAGQRLSAANQARQQATSSIMGGVGELVGMGSTFLPGGANARP
tara:strand:+ start:5124 stop:5738 length:615 start_codon:yes stop_codon:yes gene_type:complete